VVGQFVVIRHVVVTGDWAGDVVVGQFVVIRHVMATGDWAGDVVVGQFGDRFCNCYFMLMT